MLAVSLAGKKSRRRFAGVVEKVRWEERYEVVVVAASRRPITEEEDDVCRRGATARESWAVLLGEHSLAVVRGANMDKYVWC